MEIDINTDIYPMHVKDCMRLVIASNGNPQHDTWDSGTSSIAALADDYEYVMYGKIYKKASGKRTESEVIIYASFGGLLMQIIADEADLESLRVDDRIYLLIRRVH